MRTGWLQGTEPRGDEEALGCRGLVGEEAAAALEGVVEEEEEGEDLRGASSVVGEGVEGGESVCVREHEGIGCDYERGADRQRDWRVCV